MTRSRAWGTAVGRRVYRPVFDILSTNGWKWLIGNSLLSGLYGFESWFYRPSDAGWSIDLAR